MWDAFSEAGDRQYLTTFASLAIDARTLQNRDSKIAAAVAIIADRAEHAVVAALIELKAPEHQGAVSADDLFRHARRFTDARLEPLPILSKLESTGLVVTASNEDMTAVVPTLTGQAAAVIVGMAYRRLTRPPVPELSVLVLRLGIQPALENFTQARFGIGKPSLGGLARTAGGGDAEFGFGARGPNRSDPGLHLIARGRYADRPLWLVASYGDVDERERALAQVDAIDTDLLAERLVIDDVFRHPLEVVPEQRFVRAGTRAAGVRPFEVRETGDVQIKLKTPLDAQRFFELRVETAQLLRQRSTSIERYAMESDEPFAIYWDEEKREQIACTVYGGREAAVRVPGLVQRYDRRYMFFDIEQTLDLSPNERLQNLNNHWGVQSAVDPVFQELARRRQRATMFNSAQPRKLLVLDEASLSTLIGDGFTRLMGDARALAPLIVRETVPLPPTALYVYVLIEPPTPGWKPGCGAAVVAIELESQTDEDEVHFAMSEGGVDLTNWLPQVTGDAEALFHDAFGFAPKRAGEGFLRGGQYDVDSLLTEYGGFCADDLDLRWSDEAA